MHDSRLTFGKLSLELSRSAMTNEDFLNGEVVQSIPQKGRLRKTQRKRQRLLPEEERTCPGRELSKRRNDYVG